jgi:hypothetical protein
MFKIKKEKIVELGKNIVFNPFMHLWLKFVYDSQKV